MEDFYVITPEVLDEILKDYEKSEALSSIGLRRID